MIRKLLFLFTLFSFPQIFAQPLNGNYTIGGTSPDYPTVISAVAALEANGVSGPVIFNIRSGNYSGQSFNLTEIPGQSPSNTVTFQSETNNAADVTITSSTFQFSQGCQNITIKNIGFSGGVKKIDINGTSTYVANFTILNCIFTNIIPISISSMNNATTVNQITQIYVTNGYNILIDGNTFNNAGVAINKSGNSTDNFTFSNNTINGSIMPITINQGRNVTISGNTYTGEIQRNILSMTNMDDNLTLSGNRFNASTTGVGMTKSTITGNNTVGTNLNMNNNFFASARELEINGFINTDIMFNSFSSSRTHCLLITEATSLIAYNIYNNIFKNPFNQVSIKANMQPSLLKLNSNYNAYSNENLVYQRSYGTAIVDILNFEDWKTFSGKDMNSKISGNVFASAPDLHTPNSIVINNAGIPINGLLTDIDGQTRNATNPDIGADEFDIEPTTFRDLGIELITPATTCDGSALQVAVTNYSPFSVTGFDIECAISNNRGYITPYTTTLAPNESVTIPLTQCSISPNTWYEEYEINVANPSGSLDNNFANDRIVIENLFQYGTFEIGIENNDCNTGIKLYIPQFYGATQLWSTGEVTPLITIQNPGTYSVTVTDIGGCTITKFITVN